MSNRLLAAVLLAAMTAAAPALAHDYKLGDLVIDHPWARASAGPAGAGAVYLAVTNDGAAPDRLVAAASPAGNAALHTHISEDGIMKMRSVEAVDLPPGKTVVLEPGGLHIMLTGLEKPLVEGESVPLTLTFERAGALEVSVAIQGVAEMGDGHHHTGGTEEEAMD